VIDPFLGTQSFVASTAQINSNYATSASGGTTGDVVSNARIYTTVTGAPDAFLWSGLSVLDYQGTGGTGQHVAHYMQGIRRTVASGAGANNPQIWGAVIQ